MPLNGNIMQLCLWARGSMWDLVWMVHCTCTDVNRELLMIIVHYSLLCIAVTDSAKASNALIESKSFITPAHQHWRPCFEEFYKGQYPHSLRMSLYRFMPSFSITTQASTSTVGPGISMFLCITSALLQCSQTIWFKIEDTSSCNRPLAKHCNSRYACMPIYHPANLS